MGRFRCYFSWLVFCHIPPVEGLLTHIKAPHLDGQYAAFGKVIEGMETADAIVSVDRDGRDKPFRAQRMSKVTVETFGVDYPEPEKV